MARPKKTEGEKTSIAEILKVTAHLIETIGASNITVRTVIDAASISTGTFYYYFKNKDELLAQFIKSAVFPENPNLAADLFEGSLYLYEQLLKTYHQLGRPFMQNFYTPKNDTLAAYLGQGEQGFPQGSIMAIQEQLIVAYAQEHKLHKVNAHQLAADCCSVFKGVVFEWCLGTLQEEPMQALRRIMKAQLTSQLVSLY